MPSTTPTVLDQPTGEPLKPRPQYLRAKGRDLWDRATSRYAFRPDELTVLEEACRTRDICKRLDDEVRKGELVTVGSQGQPVAAPLLAELRLYRTTLRQLLAAIDLPEDDELGERRSQSRSSQARAAAEARWRGRPA